MERIMTNLSLLQELQAVSPKKNVQQYSIYNVENAIGVAKIAIPVDNMVEFDAELNEAKWSSIDYLIEKYQGFIVQ